MWPQIVCGWIMAPTSGSGDISGNVIFRPGLHELTSVSRRWLNQFGQSLARLKATVWPQCKCVKCKCTMAPTSGSGDMIEEVTYMPTLPGERNLSIELLSMIRERHYHTTRWIKNLNLLRKKWNILNAYNFLSITPISKLNIPFDSDRVSLCMTIIPWHAFEW